MAWLSLHQVGIVQAIEIVCLRFSMTTGTGADATGTAGNVEKRPLPLPLPLLEF